MAQDSGYPRSGNVGSLFATVAIFGMVVGMLAIMAWLLADQLTMIWRLVRFYQYTITGYIPLIGPPANELPQLLEWLKNTPSREILGSTMWEIDTHYGRNFGFLLAGLFGWIGIRRMLSGRGASGPELSHETVLDLLTPIFPHLAYVKANSPVGHPLKYKPGADNRFAMPLQVFEFAEMTPPPGLEKILSEEQLKQCRPIYIQSEKNFFAAYDKSMARKAFECQLGPPLTTLRDFSESEKKAYTYFKKRLDAKLPAKTAKALVQRLEQKHGYVRTFLMAMFEEAKLLGILTTNDELLPIMDTDRTLYWCLDSVGKDTPWIEAAGVYVHKDMESLVGIRITEPEITEAVESLERYLKLDRATEKEILEASGESGLEEPV